MINQVVLVGRVVKETRFKVHAIWKGSRTVQFSGQSRF